MIQCSDLVDLAWKRKIPVPGYERQHHLSKIYCLILLSHCFKYSKGKIQINLHKQPCCLEQSIKCPVFHQWNLYFQPWKAFLLIHLAHALCVFRWIVSWLVFGKPVTHNIVEWLFCPFNEYPSLESFWSWYHGPWGGMAFCTQTHSCYHMFHCPHDQIYTFFLTVCCLSNLKIVYNC